MILKDDTIRASEEEAQECNSLGATWPGFPSKLATGCINMEVSEPVPLYQVQCTSNSTSTLSPCNAVTYQAQSAALSLVLIAALLQASRQNYQSPVEGDALHDLTANGEQEMNIEAIKYGMLVI